MNDTFEKMNDTFYIYEKSKIKNIWELNLEIDRDTFDKFNLIFIWWLMNPRNINEFERQK